MTLKTLQKANDRSIEAFRKDLSQYYTGRATPALLDRIRVKYYDQLVPLENCAEVSVYSHDMLLIRPWDSSIISEIERAIHAANIGLRPQADAELVKVFLPKQTKESDEAIFELIKQRAERAKVAVRQNRKAVRSGLDKEDQKLLDKDIQKITDTSIKDIEEIVASKKQQLKV